ncbi:MAG: phenylalanyl-tRNA synthetase subunit alpha, partial [Desulfurococcales archaeon]|nr:phenylalanyl-tRNA synthetase subunit alpha [Desulfurococcales archaeon]
MEKGRELRLSESEYRVVEKAATTGFKRGSIAEASRRLGISESTLHSIFRLLESKGLARVSVVEKSRLRLTERGREALSRGLPEEKLLEILKSRGAAGFDEVRSELGEIAGIAIGLLKRRRLIEVERGVVRLVDPLEAERTVSATRSLLEKIARGEAVEDADASALVGRGLVREETVREHFVEFIEDPGSILERSVIEVGKLTSDMLKEGRWRNVVLRSYDVRAEPPRVL